MSSPHQQRTPLVSVHRTRKPCPVCGHRDNCAVNESGAYCRRVRSDHQGRDGGWWHPNDETQFSAPRRPALRIVEKPPSTPLADRFKRDLVYQALLRSLTLFTPHAENLRARGLDELTIVRGKFKSTPTEDEAARIVKMLVEECDLSGVPGFYKDSSGWRMVKTPTGFFIPVLDRQGLIQSLQIRRDILRYPKDPRYIWLSSNPKDYPCGTSSGALVHVQNPERIAVTGRCLITEGALKAFVASCYLPPGDGGLLALAGTSAFRENFGLHLKSVWPGLHTAIVAFDADYTLKGEVKQQLRRLVRFLKASSFESVLIRTWEYQHGKGIDDLLVSESYEVAEVAVA
jgi:DNA primase